MCVEPKTSPTTPPATSEAPTSARSNPVMAPRASSAITQTKPMMSSNQFVKLLKAELLRLRTANDNIPAGGLQMIQTRDGKVQRLRRGRDFLAAERFVGDFLPWFDAAISRRFLAAQPGLVVWRLRARPRALGGTFSVIVEPAATYAPSPIFTGATRTESLPTKTRLPMIVGNLFTPS